MLARTLVGEAGGYPSRYLTYDTRRRECFLLSKNHIPTADKYWEQTSSYI